MDNKYTLSWEAYEKNIGSSLASLQQSGEFVDMTLAADGHFVKVHQLVMSLASPYIKDLIKSAQCQHPVIFLNKISYSTLCSILEYIYTGEVTVTQRDLRDLLNAGRALHIKGLKDMEVRQSFDIPHTAQVNCNITVEDPCDDYGVEIQTSNDNGVSSPTTNECDFESRISSDEDATEQNENMDAEDIEDVYVIDDQGNEIQTIKTAIHKKSKTDQPPLQYSVSNQGGLQLVLNRHLYNLRHSSQKASGVRRQWRCVRYSNIRCAASVITMNNVIVQRKLAHTHPFGDNKILKKVKEGSIFTAIVDAEKRIENIKKGKVKGNK